jgi:hypothetical protein
MGPVPLPEPLFLRSKLIQLKLDELYWKVYAILTMHGSSPGARAVEAAAGGDEIQGELAAMMYRSRRFQQPFAGRATDRETMKPSEAGRGDGVDRRMSERRGDAASS